MRHGRSSSCVNVSFSFLISAFHIVKSIFASERSAGRGATLPEMRFTTTLQLEGRTATGFRVPPEVVEALGQGKKRPAVTVTINGYTYRSTIARLRGRVHAPVGGRESCRRRGRGRRRDRGGPRAGHGAPRGRGPRRPRRRPSPTSPRRGRSSTGCPTATAARSCSTSKARRTRRRAGGAWPRRSRCSGRGASLDLAPQPGRGARRRSQRPARTRLAAVRPSGTRHRHPSIAEAVVRGRAVAARVRGSRRARAAISGHRPPPPTATRSRTRKETPGVRTEPVPRGRRGWRLPRPPAPPRDLPHRPRDRRPRRVRLIPSSLPCVNPAGNGGVLRVSRPRRRARA